MKKQITYRLSELDMVVQRLLVLPSRRIFALTGALGAGKTTLAQELLRRLGVEGPITSPTYTYVNTYDCAANHARVHHFDLYRFNHADEFVHMGFNEYLHDKNAFVIIEWPECIAQLLPKDACFVDIQHVNEATRCAVIETPGEKHG